MATVKPFRAHRYNPKKIECLSKVVTPPFDVIDSAMQDQLYDLHENNVVRIELNRRRPGDDDSCNMYTRAAANFRAWRECGVLLCDDKPGFYLSQTTFPDAEGRLRTRTGFFARVKLAAFEEGVVLPHEQTFTKHKEDRLNLIKEVKANISPIFTLYYDPLRQVDGLLKAGADPMPLADFTDGSGFDHRLFTVTDPEVHAKVAALMEQKKIYIADGHHRYTTALNYRDYMNEKHPEAGPEAPWNYVMIYLCCMQDPGLNVWAAHRMVRDYPGFSVKEFLPAAEEYFTWRELPLSMDYESERVRLADLLAEAGTRGPSFGLICNSCQSLYLLTMKPEAMEAEDGPDVAGPLRDLDSVVLTRLILEKLLGLDNLARDRTDTIDYVADVAKVLERVRGGDASLALLMNPTKVRQVKAVAEAGLTMPRKATYFYPKVLTGLTLHQVCPD